MPKKYYQKKMHTMKGLKTGRHPPARKKRVRKFGGGRTNLLEELGRVEGEHFKQK